MSDLATLSWHRLGKIPADVRGVVGFAKGYVALSGDGEIVYFSADGRAWRKVRLPLDPPAGSGAGSDANGLIGRAVASRGGSVLVVGGYSHEPCQAMEPGTEPDTGGGPECDYSPVTWVSDDGVHWQSAFPDAGSTEFVAAWPAAAGGWDAAASGWYGVCLGGQELWRSDDGLTWRRLKPRPPAAWEGYDPDVPVGVASDSGSTLLAASERGTDFETTLAMADGGPWRVLGGYPGFGAQVTAGTAPAGAAASWVLGGMTYDESGCNPEVDGDLCGTQTPTIWSSTDGGAWTTTTLAVGPGVPADEPGDPELQVTSVTSMALSERGYVAVGAESAYAVGARHETWVSGDGLTWQPVPQTDRPTFDFGPGLVANGPAGVIGISVVRWDGESTAWELR